MHFVDSKTTVHSYRNQRETCCFRILGAIKGCPLLGPYLKPISPEVFAIVAVPAMIQIVQECQEIRRCSPCGAEPYSKHVQLYVEHVDVACVCCDTKGFLNQSKWNFTNVFWYWWNMQKGLRCLMVVGSVDYRALYGSVLIVVCRIWNI